ncbi:unnamed protein product [Caenorhabditis bovis]|uniref:BZIP domain-containing protein n=1 Tax=Caenorhabditis bovis TaxID=2654633 RepID=A0A8S1EAG6_9PELO|nr:unnamed protein product [Caenorhabditis bovis]
MLTTAAPPAPSQPTPALVDDVARCSPSASATDSSSSSGVSSVFLIIASVSFHCLFDFQRCCSNESASTSRPIRRGRPQQTINDGDDEASQKKKHRRMYARKYRAEMRQKVDNERALAAEVRRMSADIARLEQQRDMLNEQLQRKDALINQLLLGPYGRVNNLDKFHLRTSDP